MTFIFYELNECEAKKNYNDNLKLTQVHMHCIYGYRSIRYMMSVFCYYELYCLQIGYSLLIPLSLTEYSFVNV